MTNLKSVNVGMNRFCGPAVLSILTGKSTDECARVISQISGNYNVVGVLLTDLLRAADKMGYDSVSVAAGNSLYGTLVRLANEDGMYIVTVPNHFVVIEIANKKAYFCDNHTREPIPAGSSARLGQAVISAYKVIKRPEPVKPPEPKLIMTSYNVIISNNRLCVDRVLLYDSGDNKKEEMGYIKAKDDKELIGMIRVLKDELE